MNTPKHLTPKTKQVLAHLIAGALIAATFAAFLDPEMRDNLLKFILNDYAYQSLTQS